VPQEWFYDLIDVLAQVGAEFNKSVAQVALNWLLQRPTVACVLIGARDEAQLQQNLDAAGWHLTAEQMARIDAASERDPIYPYWHQRAAFGERNPPPVPSYK
jgi:aryl-alcohol dehydrogenase-like predicted oxidoreductase